MNKFQNENALFWTFSAVSCMQQPLGKYLVDNVYFISLYIQNLEPGVSYFGIVLFLRWIRGGTQGCPYQHPVSNEGAGISAVQ